MVFTQTNDNEVIIEGSKDDYYLNYQKDEFTRIICGYVVKQDDGRYRTHRLGTFDTNFKDRNVGYFDSLKDGIAYMKQVYIQELYPTHKDLGKEILDSSNTFVEVEEDLDEIEK